MSSIEAVLDRGIVPRTVSNRAFFGVTAFVFIVSAVVTIVWCNSMSAMGGMSMPGGWTMSMTWMRMPGQTWLGVAASFIGMWMVMMVAMMLPSLVPMLLRYRDGARRQDARHLGSLTTTVGLGYFFIWTSIGVAAFPLGVALAMVEMRIPDVSRAVPVAAGTVVLFAGLLQFTAWKTRQLACCRGALGHERIEPVGIRTAWKHGVRLGVRCVLCCASLTTVLLVIGVMDLRAMAVVTAGITAERLAPTGERVARWIGMFLVAAGLYMTVRAGGLG